MDEVNTVSPGLPPAAPTTSPLSQGERIVDTFIAPSKTFADILRDKSWWLPFLLAILVGYGYLFALQSKVGWDQVAQNAMKQDPKAAERMANASPEQRAQAAKLTTTIIKSTFYASPVLALLFAAVASLVLWGTINFIFGGHAAYGRVFAVWMYGTLPLLLTSILAIVALFAGLDRDQFNINNPVGTNLGFYLGAETPKWLMTLAGAIDVVWIWAYILVGIGLAIVAKTKKSSGLIAVFGWVVLILLVRVVIAAI